MADETHDRDEPRSEFLIAMYNQMMNDINRHIVVVWQSVGVLFGAFAAFALVEKHVITMDIAATLIILVCIWVIGHVYDASYWYNRNLVIIANIERQFLKRSDLSEVHYYFGAHRRTGDMITHLELQRWLAVGVGALILIVHVLTVLIPIVRGQETASATVALPWICAVVGLIQWHRANAKAIARYDTFLRNSPGKKIDATGIEHGPGHPVGDRAQGARMWRWVNEHRLNLLYGLLGLTVGIALAVFVPKFSSPSNVTEWNRLSVPQRAVSFSAAAVFSDIPPPDITAVSGQYKFLSASASLSKQLGYVINVAAAQIGLSKLPQKYRQAKESEIRGVKVTTPPIQAAEYGIIFTFDLKDADGFELLELKSAQEELLSGKTNHYQNIAAGLVPADVAGRTKSVEVRAEIVECVTCKQY